MSFWSLCGFSSAELDIQALLRCMEACLCFCLRCITKPSSSVCSCSNRHLFKHITNTPSSLPLSLPPPFSLSLPCSLPPSLPLSPLFPPPPSLPPLSYKQRLSSVLRTTTRHLLSPHNTKGCGQTTQTPLTLVLQPVQIPSTVLTVRSHSLRLFFKTPRIPHTTPSSRRLAIPPSTV